MKMQRIITVLFLLTLLVVPGCQEKETAPDPQTSSPRGTVREPDPFPEEEPTPQSPPGIAKTSNSSARTPAPPLKTERQVLEEMVQAYKSAKSYGDNGKFITERKDGNAGNFWPCEFAWYAPNLVRMRVTDGMMITNETHTLATIPSLWGQLLKIPAPEKTSIASLYPDPMLAEMTDLLIPSDIFWVPPQVILLFAKDPLKTLAPEGAKLSFLTPMAVEYPSENLLEKLLCDRIQIEAPGGTRVFWIDRKTRELMRIDLPIPLDPVTEKPDPNISSFRLELERAELNITLPPETFTIQYPENAIEVENFTPWPVLLQGKPLESFDKISVDSLSEANIPLSDYADKVLVLQFWSTEEKFNKDAIQKMYKVYEKMKGNPRVQFLAVCFDPSEQVSNDSVNELLRGWNAPLPTCRLPDTELPKSLRLFFAPNLVILGKNGNIARYFQPGPNSEDVITQAINDVLDGKVQEHELTERIKDQRKEYLEHLQSFIKDEDYSLPSNVEEEDDKTEIAPREMPKTLKLEQRGTIQSLRSPGNILVVSREREGEEPQFLVPFEKNRVAILDADCREINRTQPKTMLSTESITVVRTALNSEGKRIYITAAPNTVGENRIHVFDENFNSILFYPQERNETSSLLVTDIRVADLDGDKDPEIIFSAVDLSGNSADNSSNTKAKGFLRAIKLDGSVLWNHELMYPYRIGIAFSAGKTSVLAMHSPTDQTVLNEYDAKGNFMRDINLKDGNPISWFTVDDLAGTGESTICVSVPQRDRSNETHIAEIDRSGNQDWEYPFSSKVHKVPLEHIIAADITGDSTKEWIFASADGILHFLTAKGKKIDQYAHGKEITGFNVAQIAGRPVLIIADADAITSYEIQ